MRQGLKFEIRYDTAYLYGIAMRFAVRFLRRKGRVLPWAEVANQQPRYGDLRIEECLDDQLKRHLRTARLSDVGRVKPDSEEPMLMDVQITAMSPQAFTLTGFERVDGVEFMQSWLVTERGLV